MDERLEPLFDDRNKDLWEELNEQYNIQVKVNSEPGYLTDFKDDVITIFVDEKDINPASFTHELLHIFLKSKGVLVARDLRDSIKNNENLSHFFSTSLQEQIGNTLEHQKMIGLYRERGFEDHKFVNDYEVKIMDTQQLDTLLTNYRIEGSYKRDIVDKYIGKFFSMKASNNRNYDYSPYYQRLNSLDGSLFQILDKFWKEWLEYDIEDPKEEYRGILASFLKDLDRWVEKRDFR